MVMMMMMINPIMMIMIKEASVPTILIQVIPILNDHNDQLNSNDDHDKRLIPSEVGFYDVGDDDEKGQPNRNILMPSKVGLEK